MCYCIPKSQISMHYALWRAVWGLQAILHVLRQAQLALYTIRSKVPRIYGTDFQESLISPHFSL